MNILHIGICAYGRIEGLSEAFMNVSDVYHEERPENVTTGLKNLLWRPDIVFLQVQSDNYPSALPSILRHWKNKGSKVVQWSGDIRNQTPSYAYQLAPHCTVSCFSNDRDVENLRKAGHRAEFLQVGIDPKVFTPEGFAEPSAGEVVFLANHNPHFPNGRLRMLMVEELKKTYGQRFKLYGVGWKQYADGECNVKNPLNEVNMWQKKEAAIYRGCKIAISMSQFTESRYTSDRLFRAIGSGAFTVVHRFPEVMIPECETFNHIKDLKAHINHWLEHPERREEIAKRNCDFVHNNYTYAHMVQNIIEL